MKRNKQPKSENEKKKPQIFSLLTPYRPTIFLLIVLTLVGNGANLVIPKIISHGIDSYTGGMYVFKTIAAEFLAAGAIIFLFTYLQGIVQTYASEKVGLDLRGKLSEKISRQSYDFVQKMNPSVLLTNLTSDIDAVKMFVAQAISAMVSSLITIVGASILLLMINWRLALAIIAILPIIGGAFFIVLRKVRILFKRGREVIDWLNKVINESILGASIIRVVNAQHGEYLKFMDASIEAKNIGVAVVKLFATLIPIVMFVANLATLSILALGGHFVINGSMTLGEFAAFNSYVVMFVFPIIVIGFMSSVIAQASASYQRIHAVLSAPDVIETGTMTGPLSGKIELKNVTVSYNGKPALNNVSLTIAPGSKTAIIGPTAAGKSQLLYLMTGLIRPDSGTILFNGKTIDEYDKDLFYRNIGFVFQESVMFNMSVRENIAFNNLNTNRAVETAVDTAELTDFIESLPQKLETVVSERGNSLSGGQQQRIMLARALSLRPNILLLDDFTARVDAVTEQKILSNVEKNYPGITVVSVTQKISSIEKFDQIIVLMEGEVIAAGTHRELMENCPEYIQIFQSQRSTSNYELQS
jgi:ATP-binding cassette, subfamily B, bacterial